jgi:hypothetical protein
MDFQEHPYRCKTTGGGSLTFTEFFICFFTLTFLLWTLNVTTEVVPSYISEISLCTLMDLAVVEITWEDTQFSSFNNFLHKIGRHRVVNFLEDLEGNRDILTEFFASLLQCFVIPFGDFLELAEGLMWRTSFCVVIQLF